MILIVKAWALSDLGCAQAHLIELHDYKNKKRAHLGMQGNAGRLSDKEIADVSVYLGTLKSKIHDLSEHED